MDVPRRDGGRGCSRSGFEHRAPHAVVCPAWNRGHNDGSGQHIERSGDDRAERDWISSDEVDVLRGLVSDTIMDAGCVDRMLLAEAT